MPLISSGSVLERNILLAARMDIIGILNNSESSSRWKNEWKARASNNMVSKSQSREILGYWEHSVKILTTQQRTSFTVVVILIMVLAIFGNVLTIITNIRREQRHLFRICLLSLALSDISFVTITTVVYLSQFDTEYSPLWSLGELMCTFAPFFQTLAILVNSITLVAIALDRYMAVVRITKGTWQPSGLFCVTCAVLIWGLAAGISSPMLTLYEIYHVFILISDPQQPNVITDFFMAEMCATDKTKNGYYFGIIFAIIFLPLVLAFLWLNTVIAKEIWKRRNPVDRSKKGKKPTPNESSSDRKTTTTNLSSCPPNDRNRIFTIQQNRCTCSNCLDANSPPREPPPPPPPPHPSTARSSATNTRKKRQLRMFKVIVVLMVMFLVCRLPTWVFLLVKLYGVANTNLYWVLHYTFGIMAMLNGALNPLLYTFLGETIKVSMFLKTKCIQLTVEPCRRTVRWVKSGFNSQTRKHSTSRKKSHRDGIFFGD
ncbi:neuropeptide receptor npr-1 [Uranotaenia lowii]|uniref:neuropeptide receptor npr-1 n=1 Tax=Uranotaenia lowii TaxID=190385 RepID=UPI0024796ADB|nr:neuropeptide receptor npr-1 [Uranotaenia lowii]